MKKQKPTVKPLPKDLAYEAFMKAPIPMSITKAEDGTYVEINEAAREYIGLQRKDIIGRKVSDFGIFPENRRHLFIDQIKKYGVASNIPLNFDLGNRGVLKQFFGVYPIKKGRKEFFLSFAHASFISLPKSNAVENDQLRNYSFLDYQNFKSRLAQFHLTPRQQEIALLSAIGKNNSEIALHLCISEYTVKDHMKEIYRIIGVTNRSELLPKMLSLK